MQLHTDRAVGRPMSWPQAALASRGYPRLAHTQRPEPHGPEAEGPHFEGLSSAELRRIVAEVLG